MAFNLDLTLFLSFAVCACSGVESNPANAGGTSALGGRASTGGATSGGANTGGTAYRTGTGGHSSGGSSQTGGKQASGGTRTSIMGCDARPDGDAMCSGVTPHYVACVGDTPQNTGCKVRTIGNLTDTYCCP